MNDRMSGRMGRTRVVDSAEQSYAEENTGGNMDMLGRTPDKYDSLPYYVEKNAGWPDKKTGLRQTTPVQPEPSPPKKIGGLIDDLRDLLTRATDRHLRALLIIEELTGSKPKPGDAASRPESMNDMIDAIREQLDMSECYLNQTGLYLFGNKWSEIMKDKGV